jgi:hypothetical protein
VSDAAIGSATSSTTDLNQPFEVLQRTSSVASSTHISKPTFFVEQSGTGWRVIRIKSNGIRRPLLADFLDSLHTLSTNPLAL